MISFYSYSDSIEHRLFNRLAIKLWLASQKPVKAIISKYMYTLFQNVNTFTFVEYICKHIFRTIVIFSFFSCVKFAQGKVILKIVIFSFPSQINSITTKMDTFMCKYRMMLRSPSVLSTIIFKYYKYKWILQTQKVCLTF